MKSIVAKRAIDAPLDVVFRTVADIRNFSKVVPEIVDVEFLTDLQSGVGARFRETRLMNGRKATTELEVTECEENDHVRLVSDAGGTVWDTVFETRSVDGKVELTMTMDVRPYRLLAKMLNPLIRGMLVKAIERDMDAVKEHCERRPD